jgi:hypothetical protein
VSGGKDVSMMHSAISTIDTQTAALNSEIPIDAAHVGRWLWKYVKDILLDDLGQWEEKQAS